MPPDSSAPYEKAARSPACGLTAGRPDGETNIRIHYQFEASPLQVTLGVEVHLPSILTRPKATVIPLI